MSSHGGTTAVTQYFCYQCDGTVYFSLSSTDPLCPHCSGVLEQRVNPNPYSYTGGFFTGPASKSAIEALVIVKIDEGILNSDNNNNCSVCLNTFKADGVVKEMPCKHIYHKGCIDGWLKRQNTCPTCRFELPTEARASRGEEISGGGQAREEFDDEGEGVEGWAQNRFAQSYRFASRGGREGGTTRGGEGRSGGGQAREEEEEEEEEGVEDPSRNFVRGGRRGQPTRIGYYGTLQP